MMTSIVGPADHAPTRELREMNKKDEILSADVRYNLRLPRELYIRLSNLAVKHGTNRLELMKKFMKLGILVLEAQDDPDKSFYFMKKGVSERVLML